jgi:monofunctional biosynthetic peptidoglycan transglycosylase
VIEWGDGIWGAEAASVVYFHTSASALTPEQAALLAAAISNPRASSPARPDARLVKRQQVILGRMGAMTPPASTQPPVPTLDIPIQIGLPPGIIKDRP